MEKPLYRIGFWSASVASVAVLGFDIAQILQIIGTLGYPWDEIHFTTPNVNLVFCLLQHPAHVHLDHFRMIY